VDGARLKCFLYAYINMARNTIVRRLIVETLWERGPMTKGQMYAYITANFNLLREPSEHALSSIMNKNSQVIPVGKTRAETETGDKALHTLFDINREYIRSHSDLVMTMPITILKKGEKTNIGRCPICARKRILTGNDICLMCERELSEEE